jgi:hypothetical protein
MNRKFDVESVTARRTIYHGGTRATCMVLPVISESGENSAAR